MLWTHFETNVLCSFYSSSTESHSNYCCISNFSRHSVCTALSALVQTSKHNKNNLWFETSGGSTGPSVETNWNDGRLIPHPDPRIRYTDLSHVLFIFKTCFINLLKILRVSVYVYEVKVKDREEKSPVLCTISKRFSVYFYIQGKRKNPSLLGPYCQFGWCEWYFSGHSLLIFPDLRHQIQDLPIYNSSVCFRLGELEFYVRHNNCVMSLHNIITAYLRLINFSFRCSNYLNNLFVRHYHRHY